MTNMMRTLSKIFALAVLAASPASAQYPQPQYPTADPMLAWCSSTVEELGIAQARAYEARIFIGPRGEVDELKAGLSRAMQGQIPYPWPMATPLTRRALERGITIAVDLEARLGTFPGGLRTVAHFLHRYYDHVRKVARELDMRFIPMTYCPACAPSIPNYAFELQRRTVDFAVEQLTLANRELTTATAGQVFPVGPADAPSTAYFAVLKSGADFAVADLREALQASPYACLILRLQQLRDEATSALASSSEYQRAYVLRRLHGEVGYWARELQRPQYCSPMPYPGGNPADAPGTQWPQPRPPRWP